MPDINLPILSGEERTSVCQFGFQACPSGYQYGPAMREHFLIHYIVSGKGMFFCDQGAFTVKKGEAFLIRPGEITTYRADEADPWQYYWVGFYGRESADLVEECAFRTDCPVVKVSDPVGLCESFREVLSLPEDLQHRRMRLVSALYRCMDSIAPRESAHREGYVSAAITMMAENFSYPITVEDIAARVGLNRSYLYKLFKEETGRSPKEYLLDLRIAAARRMLASGQYTVTETAYSCGFSGVAHFSATFRSRVGVSASAYAQSHQPSPRKDQ